MDLKAAIAEEHSKAQANKIARWIGADKNRFAELMNLFLRGEYRITQRSAWIVSISAAKHPELIRPYMKKMLEKTREKGVHDAVKRNVFRILSATEIPKTLHGMAATICFDFLADKNEPIAVRVFSMSVLLCVVNQEPDLKEELKTVILDSFNEEGPAYKSRGTKVLKALSKIK